MSPEETMGKERFNKTIEELTVDTNCNCASCALARLNRRLLKENRLLKAEIKKLRGGRGR